MKNNSIKNLNRKMFSLVSSFPKASGELIDFHYKSYFEEYIESLQNNTGRKLMVFANSVDELSSMIRKLMLLSDSIIFNINTYSTSPKITIFPIPDDTKSPVLGITPVLDPVTHQNIIPSPAVVAYAITTFSSCAIESKIPDSIFGYEWNRPDSAWQRSSFTRTSESYVNGKKQKCHIAVGLGYEYEQSTYNWLLGEAKQLLFDGHLIFAPFVRSTPGIESIGERIHKAKLSFSRLTIQDDKILLPSGKLHPLALLDVPYIENIPLELLAKALKDESESLSAFRKIVDRSIEDITKLEDPIEIDKEITRIKRDLIEDELNQVNKLCQRLTRMKSFSAVSAVIATTSITAVAAMNVGLPALVLAGSTAITAKIAEYIHIYEQQKEIKNSPMHFLWKLGRLK